MDFDEYFRTKNLRKTPCVGVHFEQKITPDLIWCVAYVVLDLIQDDENKEFSDRDIRESSVFNDLMQDYFSKAPQDNAENEYNKVSSYQLGVLSFAGILTQISSRPKKYKVNEIDILKFIAVNDLNASKFLCEYTEKFINDNGLGTVFEEYKQHPDQEHYMRIKEEYWQWAKQFTAIRGEDRKHTYRVLNKIFNVFCYKNRLPGEDASNIIDGPCPYAYLIYNRENFRDKDKPSGMTRQQYQEQILTDINSQGVVETLLQKAKDAVARRHNNESEIQDPQLGYLPESGIHVHHILPRQSYSQFTLAKENLICLTPGQHFSCAHIKGNTRTIDPQYQLSCLKMKLHSIKESMIAEDGFYSLSEYIKMLNELFNLELKNSSTIEEVEAVLAAK